MTTVVSMAASLAVLLLLFSLLVVWSRRDDLGRWTRSAAIVLALACGGFSFVTAFEALGRPTVPISGINIPRGKVPVVGFKLDPGKAIYIMVDVKGGPMLYQLPWDPTQANQMQQMKQAGQPMDADSGADGKDGTSGSNRSSGTRVVGRPDPRGVEPTKSSPDAGQVFNAGG